MQNQENWQLLRLLLRCPNDNKKSSNVFALCHQFEKYAVGRSFEPLTVSLFHRDRPPQTDNYCWGKESLSNQLVLPSVILFHSQLSKYKSGTEGANTFGCGFEKLVCA